MLPGSKVCIPEVPQYSWTTKLVRLATLYSRFMIQDAYYTAYFFAQRVKTRPTLSTAFIDMK
jgi:hypothetical protein